MKKILVVLFSVFLLGASSLSAAQMSASDSAMLFGQSSVDNVAVLDNSEMVSTEGELWFTFWAVAVVSAVYIIANPHPSDAALATITGSLIASAYAPI